MRHTPRHRAMKTNRAPRAAAVSVAATAAVAVPMMGLASPASADGTDWDQVAQCESGGNWSTNTGNGYSGGLQFQQQTWEANGGSGSPENASKKEQIRVAENVKDSQGMGAWPECGAGAGGGGGQANAQQQGQQGQQEQAQQQPQQQQQGQQEQTQQQPQQQQQEVPQGSGNYTVKSGDTLGKIAKNEDVDGGWKAIYNANKSTVKDPAMIFPGQKLQLQ